MFAEILCEMKPPSLKRSKVKKLTYGSTVVSTFILYISTWILMIHYHCIQIKGKVGGKHSLLIILIFLMH